MHNFLPWNIKKDVLQNCHAALFRATQKSTIMVFPASMVLLVLSHCTFLWYGIVHPSKYAGNNMKRTFIFEWTTPLIARLIRLMLIWTLLSPNCAEYYTEQPSDQTAQSLRQKRQFPRREFTSPLRERGTQGGRERRSESKGWKSVVESKRWLLPEVICLFAALSTDVGAPFFQ